MKTCTNKKEKQTFSQSANMICKPSCFQKKQQRASPLTSSEPSRRRGRINQSGNAMQATALQHSARAVDIDPLVFFLGKKGTNQSCQMKHCICAFYCTRHFVLVGDVCLNDSHSLARKLWTGSHPIKRCDEPTMRRSPARRNRNQTRKPCSTLNEHFNKASSAQAARASDHEMPALH